MTEYEHHKQALADAIKELREAEKLYAGAEAHQWDYANAMLLAAREKVNAVIRSAKLLNVKEDKPVTYTYGMILKDAISNVGGAILCFWDGIREHLLGYWYCNYCGKLHSFRVKKYDPTGRNFLVCSKGEDKPYKQWKTPPTNLENIGEGLIQSMKRIAGIFENPEAKRKVVVKDTCSLLDKKEENNGEDTQNQG